MSAHRFIILLTDSPSEQPLLVQCLRSAAGDRDVRVASTIAEALALLTVAGCEAIFCHLQAGDFEAVNFLGEVWKRRPHIARFLIASELDSESELRCAFAGHHFLKLPLETRQVEQALKGHETAQVLLPNERIQMLVSRIRAFPSKPAIYTEVVAEVRSRTPDPGRIARIIETDVGISAKLLQVVNSPFYGRAQPASELTEVVLFLGFDLVESIVLSLEALSRYDRVSSSYLTAESVWTHSQRVAELSRRICHTRERERGVAATAYLSGLLHDIGKLAFAQNLEEDYREIVRAARCEKRPLYEIELDAWGVTHADAGAYLLGLWGLPFSMVEAVATHHSPPQSFARFGPAFAVHLAENLVHGDARPEKINELYPVDLRLTEPLPEFTGESGRGSKVVRSPSFFASV